MENFAHLSVPRIMQDFSREVSNAEEARRKTNDMASNDMASDYNQQSTDSTTVKYRVKRFFKKYFLEGQKLNAEQAKAIAEIRADAPLSERILVKHRRLVGIMIPLVFFHVCWWTLAIKWNFFALFPDRYIMSVTMIFGSTIAGMTSEGGGAVAFPVMTLALGLAPSVGRDFSLMIQSFGMTSATFTIFWMKIKLEWHSIFFCSFGSTFGMIFGLEVIDPLLSPAEKKLGFVSIWFSFAFALFLLNRQHKRKTYDSIPFFNAWKGIILICTGFIGGIFSAIAGSGVDICSFSVLSLLFRVSEKVSTPTSVVLMAFNTLTGFFWRQLMTETGCEPEAWKYLAVAVPVAVLFAPVGAFLSSHFHRQVAAAMIYILDTLALVSALALLPMTWQLWVLSCSLVLGGFLFFFVLSVAGERLIRYYENKKLKSDDDDVVECSSNSDISNNNGDTKKDSLTVEKEEDGSMVNKAYIAGDV